MDLQHVAELAVMSIVSFAGSWGAIRARLVIVEKSTAHAHARIDTMLMRKSS